LCKRRQIPKVTQYLKYAPNHRIRKLDYKQQSEQSNYSTTFNSSIGYSRGKLLEHIPEVCSNEISNKLHAINKTFIESPINGSLEQGNASGWSEKQEVDWGKSLLYCNIRNGRMNFNGYKNIEVYYEFELNFIIRLLHPKDALVTELYNKAKATLIVLSNELSMGNLSEEIDQKYKKVLI
jgi:hypothetical protein